MLSPTLVVAAVCFRNERGEVLTVRKQGTSAWMLPGGKLESGEAALAAAVREVSEEIGIELAPGELVLLGEFTASAANEANTSIDATIYLSAARITPVASGEIAEVRWVHPANSAAPHTPLAPLLADWVFPALVAGGVDAA
ncbi:NUDIX domain-containing protein [Cryobacterium melibiosiphilum]|uniref:NUDIX domain-containing protein n=1 Tax=Cryobacterium melibiosiphilum TaxID=995039 RepID=A0A3A5MHI3_9MICO|nr:NUDIX domain-containing protein [Cryobacterium melibiosiphilum]RJT88872.1 NUDIX domain-containing protein [Cryobacterium melibiosiphilum]